MVHEIEPRLLELFEGNWALQKTIDQRVHDAKRNGQAKRKRGHKDGKRQKEKVAYRLLIITISN